MSGATELLDALAGVVDADMVVTNGRIVDVHKKEVRDGGIAVKAGRIIRVGEVESLVGPGTEVLDARGRYLTPGLVEAHAHSYHANLNLTEYAKLCLSRGTTAVAESFYGQGQIRGKEAVRFFYEELRRTPLTLLFVVPVLAYLQNLELGLAATPGTVSGDDLFEMLDWEGCVGLEEPPYIPVAERDPVIVRLIEKALAQGKVVMGHAAGLTEAELDGYAAFGITGDHEQLTAEEAVQRVERGMMVATRETPIARNQRDVQRALTELGADPAMFMFSSDVPDAVTYATVGHIDEYIRIAVEGGVDPVDAVAIGSYNTARYYRVDHMVGGLAPGRQADILMVGDLEAFDVQTVIAKGTVVVADGERVHRFQRPVYPAFLRGTVGLKRPVEVRDLAVRAPAGRSEVTVRAIGAESLLSDERRFTLPVAADGTVAADVEGDVLKVAMWDRYGRWAEPAVAFMQGFGLRRGAIATSYNPFYNNVMALGTNDADMALAANTVDELGGAFVAVADGEVLGSVALPLVGLLSDGDSDEVVPQLERLYAQVAEELGCKIEWPFHNFAFTAVVGELPILKMCDRGLFDVAKREHLSTIVEEE
ncbi:MAG TPA: adenine deaminase C-terminal domain-containing protein [Solirubrobacterales bacterium]|nr:adenine deaminase C-terminal domain-containing protein [Solirubrobacterales bacterium]